MLKEIRLRSFRCYPELVLEGLASRQAFTGENGKGKTSILEAVCFLSRCKSFRTHQTRELIHWGQSGFGVAGVFENEAAGRLKVEWTQDDRFLSVDQQEKVSFREYWGRFHTVVFQNSDRHLLQGPGQLRRQWADSLIASIHPEYLQWVQRAQLLLKQKNALLRKPDCNRGLWESMTIQLEALSRNIHESRKEFTLRAADILEAHYAALTGRQEGISITYEADIPRQLEKGREALWEREKQYASAQLGPHRDDWRFMLEGKGLRSFGSEGQVKSAALAARLLESQMIHEKTGRWALILVDDALNDLDEQRQEHFWKLLPEEAQWLYATPSLDRISGSSMFNEKTVSKPS